MAQSTKSDLPVKKNAFVHKLYDMLNNKTISHLIWWADTPEANTFLLCPNREFAEALSSYFKHENVASFVRQLHMYGFHKVSDPTPSGDKGSAVWEFRHSLGKFRKDDEASLVFIKRRLQLNSQSHTETAPLPGQHYDMSQYYYKPQYVQFVPNMSIYGPHGVAHNHPAFQANIHNQQALAHNQAIAHNMPLPQNHQVIAQSVQHQPGQPGQPHPGFAYYPVPIAQQGPGSHLPLLSQQLPPGFQQGHPQIVFPPYPGAGEVNEPPGFAFPPGAHQPHTLPQLSANVQAPPQQYQPVFQGHWQGQAGNVHFSGENQAMAERSLLLAAGAGLKNGNTMLSAASLIRKPETADILPLAKPLTVEESVDQKGGEVVSQNSKDATPSVHNPSITLRPSWSERQSQSLVECLTPVIGQMNQGKDGKPFDQWQPRPLEIVQGLPKDGIKADSPRGSYKPLPLPSISESIYYNTPTLLPAQFPSQSVTQPPTQPVTQSTTQSTTQNNTQNNTPQIGPASVSDGNTRRLYTSNNSSEPSSAVLLAFPPDSSIPKLPLLDVLNASTNVATSEINYARNASATEGKEVTEEKRNEPSVPVSSVAVTPLPAVRHTSAGGFASYLLNDSPPKEVPPKGGRIKIEEKSVNSSLRGGEDSFIIGNDDIPTTGRETREIASRELSPAPTNGKDSTTIKSEKRNTEGTEIHSDSAKSSRASSKLGHLLDDDDANRKVKRREL